MNLKFVATSILPKTRLCTCGARTLGRDHVSKCLSRCTCEAQYKKNYLEFYNEHSVDCPVYTPYQCPSCKYTGNLKILSTYTRRSELLYSCKSCGHDGIRSDFKEL